MRIVHFLQRTLLEQGGVVRFVLDIAGATAARGHDVALFTHDTKDIPQAWRRGDAGTPRVMDLGPIASRTLRLTPRQAAMFQAEIARADCLHIHACWNAANMQLAALANRLNKPYVQSIHGMLDDWSMAQSTLKKKVFLALGGSKMLRGAAFIHCTAENELAQARRWFAPAEGAVAAPVFDVEPYRTLPGPGPAMEKFAGKIDANRPTVLFLSRVHYKKGPDVFVRTIAELKRRGVDCQGLLAGAGDEPSLRTIAALIEEQGVQDRVRLLGMASGEAKVSLQQLADVFALPTSQENFGFVFPESLAAETPVVTTTGVDTHPELTASGGAVIVTDRTPQAFADAIAPLLVDRARREHMGRAGRDWVFRELNPDRIIERYEALYRSAAAKKSGRSTSA